MLNVCSDLNHMEAQLAEYRALHRQKRALQDSSSPKADEVKPLTVPESKLTIETKTSAFDPQAAHVRSELLDCLLLSSNSFATLKRLLSTLVTDAPLDLCKKVLQQASAKEQWTPFRYQTPW